MSQLEERLLARWSATHFLVAGAVIAGLGYLPLQLYILFGPADGNPIGLGLLAVVAVPLGALVVAIGLLKLLVGWFIGRQD